MSAPPSHAAEASTSVTVARDAAVFRESIARVRAAAAGETEGVFGPASGIWQVSREAVLVLGGVRALLLQLAHPAVAAGVAQHSTFSRDFVGRLFRSVTMPYHMVFGDLATATQYAARINARHHAVRGSVGPEPRPPIAPRGYRANDPELLFWVQATLIDTTHALFETLVRPLTAAENARIYADQRLFAGMMGIPPDAVPPTFDQFQAYFAAMLAGPTLQVGRDGRAVWATLRAPPVPLQTLSYVGSALAAGLLPDRLRAGFGLPWGISDRARYRVLVGALRRVVPRLPAPLRYTPLYLVALARIARARGERPPRGVALAHAAARIADRLMATDREVLTKP